jgi:hypothetical protein
MKSSVSVMPGNYCMKLLSEVPQIEAGPSQVNMVDIPALVFVFGQKSLYQMCCVGKCTVIT